ncbi:ubiquitin related modifier 1 [Babesia microti strain RI]|uniref:Ubiquitin-related modifier 1 n=1 Tax=Babesia microti (strain RI) TaxID=1133968 RepID=A0A1R4AB81_BABMR|nr:ubiquitin related modifier 1 [Babesia microti strain RI]SJK86194.1 ubiquitin related modifier 1 [Babesia microti strain RI]|eukprot:XP_012648623.2 ubiquitin related modifier 1 [Babesia microti strain RI]
MLLLYLHPMHIMNLTIEFGGGVDTFIVGNHRYLHLQISPSYTPNRDASIDITIGNLLAFLRENLASSQPNLLAASPTYSSKSIKFGVQITELGKIFDLDASVASKATPGIIILVNETDYELLGGVNCKLVHGQNIAIIGTLHGG